MKRVTLTVSDDVLAKVRRLAAIREQDVGEFLGDAIGLADMATDAVLRDGRVLVENRRGKVQEVIWPVGRYR